MTSTAWPIRLYDAADEVFWALKLNLLWILCTLAGGVLLGLGPATLAAYVLARRHARGETFEIWPAYTAAVRREFGRGQALVLPLAAAGVLLIVNYLFLSAVLAGVALAVLAVIAAWELPMAVHYDLRTRSYLPTASRFALARPHACVLLLFAGTAFGYAVVTFPFLLVVAVGGWIQLDTWLCLRLFAENEARREAKGPSHEKSSDETSFGIARAGRVAAGERVR